MSLLRPSASLAAAGTVVLWASAFPAISVAVPRLGPVGLSAARLSVASVALAAAAPFMGVRRPRSRDLGGVILASSGKPGTSKSGASKPGSEPPRPPADPGRVLLGNGPGVTGWGDGSGCATDQGLGGIRAPG